MLRYNLASTLRREFLRRGIISLQAVAITLLCGSTLFAQDAKLNAAKRSILERVQKNGADVGIAFRTLDGKDEWYSRADEPFHAASTMKVPVLIELFHQVKEGKLGLDDTLVIKNQFRSIVDGSPYKLDPADDSEADLYNSKDETRTLGQLA